MTTQEFTFKVTNSFDIANTAEFCYEIGKSFEYDGDEKIKIFELEEFQVEEFIARGLKPEPNA